MPVTALQVVPLLTKITQDVKVGRIVGPKALQTALEDVILRLNAQQASEPIGVQGDNLSDILLEMKSINEKVESCTTRLAKLQQTTSNTRPVANDTAVAQRDALVQATPEGAPAPVHLPAPAPSALPPPDPANPHTRRARVYSPSAPRAITIYPPGNPSYQTLIRDSDGNVVIALDDHEQRNPLRRQGAFSGEDQLRGLFNLNVGPGPPRINVRRPLRRQDAFYGTRHLRQVHGLRWSPHSPQSTVIGGSTDQSAQSSQDAELGTTLARSITGTSQPAPPHVKRTRNRCPDEAVKKEEEDKAKPDRDSTSVTQVPGSERVRSPAITQAQKRARLDVGRVKEEDEFKPAVASTSGSQRRRVTRSQNSRWSEMVKKEENVDDEGGDREENDDDDEGEEVKEEEVKPAISTRPHPTDPLPVMRNRQLIRDESGAKDEEKKVIPTCEARAQPRRINRAGTSIIANMQPKTRKRVRDEGGSGAEKKEEAQPAIFSTDATQSRHQERADSRPSMPLPRRRNRIDEDESNSQLMQAHPDARCVREPALKRRRL